MLHGPGVPPGWHVGVADGVPAVGVGVGVRVAVAVAVGVNAALAVAVAVAVAVPVAVAVGVGEAPARQKICSEATGTPVLSYPPANQILVVPSVSVGKLRRAVVNAGTGEFTVHMLVPGL